MSDVRVTNETAATLVSEVDNSTVKVTSGRVGFLSDHAESSDVKSSSHSITALADSPDNSTVKQSTTVVAILRGYPYEFSLLFNMGSSLQEKALSYKFEAVDFYTVSAYGDAYSRAEFNITFNFSLLDSVEITNWVRSVQPWSDDWTPEDPII